MNAYGAWVQFEWKSENYFEYWNFLSSESTKVYSQNGDVFLYNTWDPTTDYYKEKCCKQIIWKGPKYSDPDFI